MTISNMARSTASAVVTGTHSQLLAKTRNVDPCTKSMVISKINDWLLNLRKFIELKLPAD